MRHVRTRYAHISFVFFPKKRPHIGSSNYSLYVAFAHTAGYVQASAVSLIRTLLFATNTRCASQKAVPTGGTALAHGRDANSHYNATPKALAFSSKIASPAISSSSLAAPWRAPAKMAPVPALPLSRAKRLQYDLKTQALLLQGNFWQRLRLSSVFCPPGHVPNLSAPCGACRYSAPFYFSEKHRITKKSANKKKLPIPSAQRSFLNVFPHQSERHTFLVRIYISCTTRKNMNEAEFHSLLYGVIWLFTTIQDKKGR